MLFNSIDFAIFLPIVFILYWFVFKNNLRLQNVLLLVASYVFYGWWNWKFLGLIAFSTVVDYAVALALNKPNIKVWRVVSRKSALCISVFVNLGLLGVFKYYDFFVENFVQSFSFFGADIKINTLNIILPVGISFYTFQTMSYTIDVYRNKLEPTKDFIAFASFVSFFPQLVAGPIERAINLLPQFYKKRSFDYDKAVDGMRQILWGLFKKVVIADNCAEFANQIFNNSAEMNGSTLVLGAVFFTFQIYGDFSGYSDIAIGTARLLGFNLMQNFATPYFSRDIAEFWRRWHISLSTWFRDYLYIPLGGSRGGTLMKVRNVFIIFLVSGFWHGANWTFIIWGLLNALYFLPLMLTNNNRNNLNVIAENSIFPTLKELVQMLITFGLTVFAWIFFRAENITHAYHYICGIFTKSLFEMPSVFPRMTILLIICFMLVEWLGREDQFAIQRIISKRNIVFRYLFYLVLLFSLILFGGSEQNFIYFQF